MQEAKLAFKSWYNQYPDEIKIIGQGENNKNYLAIKDNQKFTVRISLRPRLAAQVKKEFHTLKLIPKGIAPEPLHFDDSKEVIPYVFEILSYIPGSTLTRWSRDHIQQTARNAAKLHKKTAGKSKSVDLKRKFYREIKQFNNTHKEFPELTAKVANKLGKVNYEECLVHDDLAVNNVIFPGARFIDWEWAHRGDPAQDLLRYFYPFHCPPWGIKLTKEREQATYKAYCSVRKDKTILERSKTLNLMIWYMDFLYCNWKLKNWKTEQSSLPKTHYEKVSKEMKKYFEKI